MSYCNGCGCPHSEDGPCGRTITEQLDNARDSLRDRIAAVIDQHRDGWVCGCGYNPATGPTYEYHVADAVIVELGLTQEFVVRHESGGGRITSDRQEAERRYKTFVERLPGVEDPGSGKLTGVECRYVTEWTPDD